MRSEQPTVLKVRIENTPSESDPEGADEFYKTLGMAVMASGRLEGQFTLCLLTIMSLPGTHGRLGYILPISWKKRAEMWRQAFDLVPVLVVAKPFFEPILTEIMDAVQDRHALVHALWEGFTSAALLTVATIHIKHKRGTTDGLDVKRADITLDMLRRIAEQADELNRKLLPISQYLGSLRPVPPEARRL